MKAWRIWLVAAVVVAVVVILGMGYLESTGRVRTAWPAMPRSSHFGADGPGWFRTAPLRSLSPYLQGIGGYLSQALVGVLLLYIAPRRIRRLSDSFSPGIVPAFRFLLIGAALAASLGAVAALASFYVHTLAVPFLLIVAYLLAAMVGGVTLAYTLGRALLRKADWAGRSPLAALLLGTLLLSALTRVPVLTPAVFILIGLTGAGAALSTRFGGTTGWSLEPLQEESVT